MTVYFLFMGALCLVYAYTRRFKDGAKFESFIDGARTRGDYYFSVCTAGLLALLMGLRGSSVGADVANYELKYGHYAIAGLNNEILYEWVNNFFSAIGLPWQGFLMLMALFSSICLLVFLYKYSDNLLLSLIMFLTIGLFQLYMSGLRQCIAISLCLLAFIALQKKRNVIFFILVALAYGFHNSAIVALVAWPFFKIPLDKKAVAIMASLALAAYAFRTPLANLLGWLAPARYQDLGTYNLGEGYDINVLVIAINALIPIFCLVVDRFNHWSSSNARRTHSTMMMLACLNLILVVLSTSSFYIGRLAYYFQSSQLVIVPNVISHCDNGHLKLLLQMLVVALCVADFAISVPGGTLAIDHYVFFWQIG